MFKVYKYFDMMFRTDFKPSFDEEAILLSFQDSIKVLETHYSFDNCRILLNILLTALLYFKDIIS